MVDAPAPEIGSTPRSDRRRARRLDIQAAACRLVISRGFDGFTMEDLAAEVGVSRRTLFNHVPDKLSAVVGEDPGSFAPEPLAMFCAGGPTGRLLDDAVHLLRTAFDQAEVDVPDAGERLCLLERAIAADPKLATAMKRQCAGGATDLVHAICAREGWVDGDLRARVVATRMIASILLVLEEVVRRRGAGSFSAVFEEVLAADAEVTGVGVAGAAVTEARLSGADIG